LENHKYYFSDILKPAPAQGTISSSLPFQIQASYNSRNKMDTTHKTLVMLLKIRVISGATSNSYSRNSKKSAFQQRVHKKHPSIQEEKYIVDFF